MIEVAIPSENAVMTERFKVPSVLARTVTKYIIHQGMRKMIHPLKYIFSSVNKRRRYARCGVPGRATSSFSTG
jgi:hypothetical protein